MKSIIVGTDFSEGSYVALELAVDVANRMACGITVVWVKREKMLFDKGLVRADDILIFLLEDSSVLAVNGLSRRVVFSVI